MKIFHGAHELAPSRDAAIAIGVFDGVHLGHQQVICQTLADARNQEADSVIVTFDRHPASIVAPDRAPAMIYPLAQRLEDFEDLGVTAALVLEFTPEMSRLEPETFIRDLAGNFARLHSVCVGRNFAFGARRSGSVGTLDTLGQELGFLVHGVPAVSLNDQPVSSTRIREAIQLGNLDLASKMLGRSYSIAGHVVRGDQRGRKMGFPTLNIGLTGLVTPPYGVYAVLVETDGRWVQGVANVGVRPTVGVQAGPILEVHLLDYSGDLYGARIEVRFLGQIRGEKKFTNVVELGVQIEADIRVARRFFN